MRVKDCENCKYKRRKVEKPSVAQKKSQGEK